MEHVLIRNPLQAPKERSCGYVRYTISQKRVPRRGTNTFQIILRKVGPASRNQERVRSCLSHSCAPSELAVGFMIEVPLRGTRSSYSISSRSWVRGYGETP